MRQKWEEARRGGHAHLHVPQKSQDVSLHMAGSLGRALSRGRNAQVVLSRSL